jgi:TolA-binding protein
VPTPSPPLLLLVTTLLAGCSGAGRGGEPKPPPIDTTRPGDALYAEGLARYGAAAQAVSQAEAARAAGDATLEQARLAEAATAYAQARALFDRLPGEFPASIRLDQAAYYAGRCSYELGLLSGLTADLADARTRLEAMIAAYPGSLLLDHALYVAGRAVFLLASGPAPTPDQTFAAARAHLAASLARAPAGTYADDAQYWLGRAWFQEGFALANVVPSPLPGSPEFTAAKADLQAAEAELTKVPQRFPASLLVDNAWYYLGQSHYMEPVDTTLSKAERIALLQAAVGDLSHVAGTASPFASGARYWRGKAHYGLAFVLAVGLVKDQAELALAIADLQAVPPPSVYADNALYWLAKAFMHVEPAPLCTGGAATPPGSGCSALAALQALVAGDQAYAASTYPAQTVAYLSTNGCTCP